jgi:hypothetical protein
MRKKWRGFRVLGPDAGLHPKLTQLVHRFVPTLATTYPHRLASFSLARSGWLRNMDLTVDEAKDTGDRATSIRDTERPSPGSGSAPGGTGSREKPTSGSRRPTASQGRRMVRQRRCPARWSLGPSSSDGEPGGSRTSRKGGGLLGDRGHAKPGRAGNRVDSVLETNRSVDSRRRSKASLKNDSESQVGTTPITLEVVR